MYMYYNAIDEIGLVIRQRRQGWMYYISTEYT
jgi:hypothetical protein